MLPICGGLLLQGIGLGADLPDVVGDFGLFFEWGPWDGNIRYRSHAGAWER